MHVGVYQFAMWGKNFAVDIESGNFFATDDIASDAIKLLGEDKKDAKRILSEKYGKKTSAQALKNLSSLKRQGIIFSLPPKKHQYVKRKITDFTLNIVNSCNLRCRYCWNEAGGYGSSSKKRKMDAKTAFKAVDLLIKESKGSKDLVVDFYGGEPLINFDLIKEVIAYCRKIEKRKGLKIRFLLATNGTLLNGERGNFLMGEGVDVAVSLDGNKSVQDRQRPFKDGRGSFDAIMKNLMSLKKGYKERIVGRATFTPYSKDIIDTFKFLRSQGFERIEVCESEKAGYGLDSNKEFFFSGSQGIQALKSLYSDLARFYAQEILKGNLNYKNTYFNRFFKQLSRLYHIQSIFGTCSAGFSLLAADLDGSIYPCTAFVGLKKFKIGSVKSGVDERALDKFVSTKISSSKSCDKCWAKRICRGCGSCYNLNYFSNKKLGQPDPYYCELFRFKTKLMIAMIDMVGEKKPGLLDKVLVPEYYVTRGQKKNK